VEAALASRAHPFWLDVTPAGEETAKWLGQHFPFHPLTLEDLLQPNIRPKLEEYEGYLFLVIHSVALADGGLAPEEVECFLGRDYLVTVHTEAGEAVSRVERLVVAGPDELGHGPDRVLYLLLNEVAERYFAVADHVDETIDALEAEVLTGPERRVLDGVFDLRRTIVTTRRLSSHLRDALNALITHEGVYVRRGNAPYLRDVHNMMVTIHELVDNQRDLTSGILEVHLSTVSNRLSGVMKRLTVVANIFLPISFVAGLFGTNFTLMPFDNVVWFALFVACLILAPLSMLYWFWRLGWL